MIENYANVVEHYSWMAYEAAVYAYGVDDPRSWEAFEKWSDSLPTTPWAS